MNVNVNTRAHSQGTAQARSQPLVPTAAKPQPSPVVVAVALVFVVVDKYTGHRALELIKLPPCIWKLEARSGSAFSPLRLLPCHLLFAVCCVVRVRYVREECAFTQPRLIAQATMQPGCIQS